MKEFFKVIGIIIGAIAGLILIVILYAIIDDKIKDNLKSKVLIDISYNTNNCSKKYPLYIKISNGTNKIINVTNFDIGVYQPGYSSDITSYSYGAHVRTDKIIEPNGIYEFCNIIPDLNTNNLDKSTLIYSIEDKYINFQK